MQPPPPQTGQFDVYSPAITVPQVSGLCRAQLVTLSFKGSYYWLLLLWALQSCPSPLPDMYSHLVICCSFLRAGPVLDHAIFVL